MYHVARFYILIGVTLVVASCAKPISSGTKTKTTTIPVNIRDYDEDLSAVRPKFESSEVVEKTPERAKEKNVSTGGQMPEGINKEVDMILAGIADKNQSIQFAAGYRVQIYVGNDRKEVDEAKAFVYQTFPELNVYLSYSQPTYKLKAGDFLSRIDAERYYAIMKQQYSAAMMIQDKIDIKKSLLIK